MVSHNYSYLTAYSFALSLTRGLRFECDLKLVTFLPLIFHIADQIFSFPAFLTGGTLVFGRRHDPEGSPRRLPGRGHHDVVGRLAGDPHGRTGRSSRARATPPRSPSAGSSSAGPRSRPGSWQSPAAHRGRQPARDPRPDRGDLLLPLLARQMAKTSTPPMLPAQLRRRAEPAAGLETGRREGNAGRDDGRAGRGGLPLPGRHRGYYQDEKATEEAFRDGWFHSGDVCEYDAEGLRIMVDRSKDMIKSGGENVSTLRVETILRSHPKSSKRRSSGSPTSAGTRRSPRSSSPATDGGARTPARCGRTAASASPATSRRKP